MKNLIVLAVLSTVALSAIGGIGNMAMPVFADDDEDGKYEKATLYCKITHFDKDNYYDEDYDNFDKSNAVSLDCKIGDYDEDDDD
ncbi:MAG TPA: hypothetical protein VFY64_08145 [Nitrososphaeraceae archaeon]|nr:hypothetical protein [Nitrososphaeraceae archaeon]